MAVLVEEISSSQAKQILSIEEGQFVDLKAKEISPASLTKSIAALANSDGGELYVGIAESKKSISREWNGFLDQEEANGHLQIFESLFPLGAGFQYEFLRSALHPGIVLHIQIAKTQRIIKASDQKPYIRRGAQNLPVNTPESLKLLEYTKGLDSFESETLNVPYEVITESDVIRSFITSVVPTAEPLIWLRKQVLVRGDKPTVAGVLLFADEPQALLPKRCGIKIYRYRTSEAEGFREGLVFDPETVEGCLDLQIRAAVRKTTEHVESIQVMSETGLKPITYPSETLHEIITNAILHRDYSIADDVHIRIFDNRIEVQSPGKLPGHITVKNILSERFARNGAVVRLLNKFPDPPNKDVGEGLNTAFSAMHKIGLKEPVIVERDNAVLVTIRHETLASPIEAIMAYLEENPTIKNRQAREITHIRADYQIKLIFGEMVKVGMIEQVPGTRTSSTAYRKKS